MNKSLQKEKPQKRWVISILNEKIREGKIIPFMVNEGKKSYAGYKEEYNIHDSHRAHICKFKVGGQIYGQLILFNFYLIVYFLKLL